jgi:alpha-glucosidase
MKNFSRSDISEFDDISSLDNYSRSLAEGFSADEAMAFINRRSRNARTPFPWSNGSNGGFNQGLNRGWRLHPTIFRCARADLAGKLRFFVLSAHDCLEKYRFPETLIYGSLRR